MKIGIITHYYKSKNYGGNLQAYALQTFLSQFCEAEQMCFQSNDAQGRKKLGALQPVGAWGWIRKITGRVFDKAGSYLRKGKDKRVKALLKGRYEAILRFNESVAHSESVYSEDTLYTALERYDAFVTGSDQVWHPSAVNSAYLLQFAQGKPKISYAASLSVSTLSLGYQETLKGALADYTAVSVREKTGQNLLQPLLKQPVQVTVDPVLLLSKTDWESVATERKIQEKYVFCYFFGDNKRARALATAYAKARGLQVVTLPYLTEKYRACDKQFGDKQLFDVSPADFLSLIRYANCVFTDSFHATVFSYIFEKEFFVFQRNKKGKLSSRLTDVLQTFGVAERFCDNKEKETIGYLDNVKEIEYGVSNERLEHLINASKLFLKKALEV